MKPERTQVRCPEYPDEDDQVTRTGHPDHPHRFFANGNFFAISAERG